MQVAVQSGRAKLLTDSTNVLWVPLAEKAFAQINEEGWLGHNSDCADGDQGECLNSYVAIFYGHDVKTIGQVAGLKATPFNDQVFDNTDSANAWAPGELALFWTCPSPCPMTIDPSVVPNHVCAMVDYDADTGIITLFDPYGLNNPDDKDRAEFQYVTAAQLESTDPFVGFEGWDHCL